MNFRIFTAGELQQCNTNQDAISKEFPDMKFIHYKGHADKIFGIGGVY